MSMGYNSQEEADRAAVEALQEIQTMLERQVEWVLTDYRNPQEVKALLGPIWQGVNHAIKTLETVQEDTTVIDRLRQLAGLSNATTFAGTPVE